MRSRSLLAQACAGLACAAGAFSSSASALCPAFAGYGMAYRSITPPPVGAGSFGVTLAGLPDGRIVALTGSTVYAETAPGSGVFIAAATLPAGLAPAEPTFLAASPDGTTIAAGVNPEVVVFPAGALAPPGAAPTDLTPVARVFVAPHYDGAWRDDRLLALSAPAATQSVVVELDTQSAQSPPVLRPLVVNVAGASGGVAFDAQGRLYTGNGFDFAPGGSETGTVKAFDPALLAAGPASFETEGTTVGDVLSAASLRFDAEGNLVVGGGDFASGDVGYLAVVRREALERALAGGATVDPANPADVNRLRPNIDPLTFYTGAVLSARGEVIVAWSDFSTGQVFWAGTVGPRRLPGDTNSDNRVDFQDLQTVLSQFGQAGPLAGDVNGDGAVDFADLQIVLTAFGRAC